METKDVVASDKDGNTVEAKVVICAQCAGEAFNIFTIKGHQHIQCTACLSSYCDGTCERVFG